MAPIPRKQSAMKKRTSLNTYLNPTNSNFKAKKSNHDSSLAWSAQNSAAAPLPSLFPLSSSTRKTNSRKTRLLHALDSTTAGAVPVNHCQRPTLKNSRRQIALTSFSASAKGRIEESSLSTKESKMKKVAQDLESHAVSLSPSASNHYHFSGSVIAQTLNDRKMYWKRELSEMPTGEFESLWSEARERLLRRKPSNESLRMEWSNSIGSGDGGATLPFDHFGSNDKQISSHVPAFVSTNHLPAGASVKQNAILGASTTNTIVNKSFEMSPGKRNPTAFGAPRDDNEMDLAATPGREYPLIASSTSGDTASAVAACTPLMRSQENVLKHSINPKAILDLDCCDKNGDAQGVETVTSPSSLPWHVKENTAGQRRDENGTKMVLNENAQMVNVMGDGAGWHRGADKKAPEELPTTIASHSPDLWSYLFVGPHYQAVEFFLEDFEDVDRGTLFC